MTAQQSHETALELASAVSQLQQRAAGQPAAQINQRGQVAPQVGQRRREHRRLADQVDHGQQHSFRPAQHQLALQGKLQALLQEPDGTGVELFPFQQALQGVGQGGRVVVARVIVSPVKTHLIIWKQVCGTCP